MKTKLFLFITVFLTFQCTLSSIQMLPPTVVPEKQIVTSTKKIYIKNFDGAYNPSIVKFKDGYLMSFRWTPNRYHEPWISYICLVLLDDSFEQISTVDFLHTRAYGNHIMPSQSEDGRIFYFNDKLYVVYNDNMELIFPNTWERRDMYIAEITYDENNQFIVLEPLRLIHETKYREKPWQKNWNPFVWEDKLLLSYNLSPHEVIEPNFTDGICKPFSETNIDFQWKYGSPRGATPAHLIDGEYLAFFHSGIVMKTSCSEHSDMWHYFMGAYTYSAEPPFTVTKVSSEPINFLGFYTYSAYQKRVIYPGGFVVDGSNVYVAYGKDDAEIWIATLDLVELKKSLVELE